MVVNVDVPWGYGNESPGFGGVSARPPSPLTPSAVSNLGVNFHNPMQKVLSNWDKRISMFKAQDPHFNLAHIAPIYKFDKQNVQSGKSPMSDNEAKVAYIAVKSGKTFKPEEGGGGVGGFIGNIGSDLGEIATETIPSLIDIGIHPSKLRKLIEGEHKALFDPAWRKAHGFENADDITDPSAWAAGLRNVARHPLLGFLPGAHVGANLTTEKGRGQIGEHPVMNALDALALIAPVTKGVSGLAPEAEAGTVLEAAQKGMPVKAAGRALRINQAGGKIADDLGFGVQARNTARFQSQLTQGVQTGVKDYADIVANHLREFIPKGMKEAEAAPIRQGLWEEVTGLRPIEPSHTVFVDSVRHAMDQAAIEGVENGKLIMHEGEVYAARGPVAKAYRRWTGYQEKVDAAEANYQSVAEESGRLLVSPEMETDVLSRSKINEAIDKARNQYEARQKTLQKYKTELDEVVAKRPPARWRNIMAQERQNQVIDVLTENALKEGFDPPTADIIAQIRKNDYTGVLDTKTLEKIFKESNKTWQEVRNRRVGDEGGAAVPAAVVAEGETHTPAPIATKEGEAPAATPEAAPPVPLPPLQHDPIFLPHITADRLTTVMKEKPLALKYEAFSTKDIDPLNFDPGVMDVGLALTIHQAEKLKEAASAEFVDYLKEGAITEENLRLLVGKEIGEHIQMSNYELTKMAARQGYESLAHVATPFFGKDNLSFMMKDAERLFISKDQARAVRGLMKDLKEFPGQRMYDKSMNVYKMAVLTTPRHIVHVLASSMAFMMGDMGIIPYRQMFTDTFRQIMHDGLPRDLSRGLDYNNPQALDGAFLPVTRIHEIAQAKTWGRMLGEFWEATGKKPLDGLRKMEETIANAHRVAFMLEKEARGASRAEAIGLANRYFMDVHGMAPIERTVMKQIFPFYAFTKQILRYVLVLPADHPIRAAILAHIAEAEYQDNRSGLPLKFSLSFFTGAPDKAGNVTAVEAKSLNPFRSLGINSPFTIAGLLSGLNPYIQTVRQLSGVNVLTNTPELFPEMYVDPQTGELRAKPKTDLGSIAETFIPETPAILQFAGFNTYLKDLKKNDPQGYWQALASKLGIPFTPRTINIPQEQAKLAEKYYHVAQQQTSLAVKEGKLPEGLKVIPYQGKFLSRAQMQLILSAAAKYSRQQRLSTPVRSVLP